MPDTEPLTSAVAARPIAVAAVVVWVRVVLVGASGTELAAWVLEGQGLPDLATVNAIARSQLSARRAGGCIRLQEVSADLSALLDLAGLLREVGGEVEVREDVLVVEEGVQRGDPIT